VYLNGDSVGE